MKKIINLYLDNFREAPEGFTQARSSHQAIELLRQNSVNILSVDFELSENNTALDFIDYFCKNRCFAKRIYIHALNPVGRRQIYQTLVEAQKNKLISSEIKIHPFPHTGCICIPKIKRLAQ